MKLSPYQKDVLSAKICPYCKSSTEVVSETDIYGKEYKDRMMIRCRNYKVCDSYVGCDDNGITLGRLASKKLRSAKMEAHKYFDKLWKERLIERSKAYEDLADYLELPDKYCHIGMFNVDTCKKVAEWSKQEYIKLKK